MKLCAWRRADRDIILQSPWHRKLRQWRGAWPGEESLPQETFNTVGEETYNIKSWVTKENAANFESGNEPKKGRKAKGKVMLGGKARAQASTWTSQRRADSEGYVRQVPWLDKELPWGFHIPSPFQDQPGPKKGKGPTQACTSLPVPRTFSRRSAQRTTAGNCVTAVLCVLT